MVHAFCTALLDFLAYNCMVLFRFEKLKLCLFTDLASQICHSSQSDRLHSLSSVSKHQTEGRESSSEEHDEHPGQRRITQRLESGIDE